MNESLRDKIIEGERELDGRDPQTLCFLMAEHWRAVAVERKAKADDYDRLKHSLRLTSAAEGRALRWALKRLRAQGVYEDHDQEMLAVLSRMAAP